MTYGRQASCGSKAVVQECHPEGNIPFDSVDTLKRLSLNPTKGRQPVDTKPCIYSALHIRGPSVLRREQTFCYCTPSCSPFSHCSCNNRSVSCAEFLIRMPQASQGQRLCPALPMSPTAIGSHAQGWSWGLRHTVLKMVMFLLMSALNLSSTVLLLVQAEECNDKDSCQETEPSVTTEAVHYLYIQVRPWGTARWQGPLFACVFYSVPQGNGTLPLIDIAKD